MTVNSLIGEINYNDVHLLTLEQLRSVEEAQAEYKRGECVSDEELKKEFEKWLKD
ncbi:MAG: hypothetical protein M3R17_16940 [Bacteroidota bacterium]|nr:hypothetical protein [Bacteroidota bacterium]